MKQIQRNTRNLIIENDNHLLQSRDYFSGSMLDLFYSTNRIKFKDNPIFISASLSMPLRGINIENDSYQAFIDLNDNNYHDINDFPDIGQALLPLNQKFDNELKITSFSFGADYEFSPKRHLQAELFLWNDNGEHNLNSSIYGGYLNSKNKLSLSYIKFAQPFSRDRFNFKGSLVLQNFETRDRLSHDELFLTNHCQSATI